MYGVVGCLQYALCRRLGRHGIQRDYATAQSELNQFGAAVQTELRHDPGPVRLNRADAQYQKVGDFLIGPVLSDEFEHFTFSFC